MNYCDLDQKWCLRLLPHFEDELPLVFGMEAGRSHPQRQDAESNSAMVASRIRADQRIESIRTARGWNSICVELLVGLRLSGVYVKNERFIGIIVLLFYLISSPQGDLKAEEDPHDLKMFPYSLASLRHIEGCIPQQIFAI
jgi:hypothetical protein